MRQLVCQVCYTKYHVSFYLCLIVSVLKQYKVLKYYDQDCSSNSLLEILPINDISQFLVGFLMHLCISFIAFLWLKFSFSAWILINSQPSSFLLLFFFLFNNQHFYHNDHVHPFLLQACSLENKDQLYSLICCIKFAYFLFPIHLLLTLWLIVLCY